MAGSRNRETAEQRHERRMEIHRAVINNTRQDFVKPTKLKGILKLRPSTLFAILAFVGFLFVIISRVYTKTDIIESGAIICVYDSKIYQEYTEPLFAEITKASLSERLGVLNAVIIGDKIKDAELLEFDSTAYDLGILYTLKDYDLNEWLVIQYEGKFHLMKYLRDLSNNFNIPQIKKTITTKERVQGCTPGRGPGGSAPWRGLGKNPRVLNLFNDRGGNCHVFFLGGESSADVTLGFVYF